MEKENTLLVVMKCIFNSDTIKLNFVLKLQYITITLTLLYKINWKLLNQAHASLRPAHAYNFIMI